MACFSQNLFLHFFFLFFHRSSRLRFQTRFIFHSNDITSCADSCKTTVEPVWKEIDSERIKTDIEIATGLCHYSSFFLPPFFFNSLSTCSCTSMTEPIQMMEWYFGRPICLAGQSCLKIYRKWEWILRDTFRSCL